MQRFKRLKMKVYEYNESEIEKLLTRKEDILVDEFNYYKDDKNIVAFLVKRFNEFRKIYQEALLNNMTDLSNDIFIRACMFFSGLVLYEFTEG